MYVWITLVKSVYVCVLYLTFWETNRAVPNTLQKEDDNFERFYSLKSPYKKSRKKLYRSMSRYFKKVEYSHWCWAVQCHLKFNAVCRISHFNQRFCEEKILKETFIWKGSLSVDVCLLPVCQMRMIRSSQRLKWCFSQTWFIEIMRNKMYVFHV